MKLRTWTLAGLLFFVSLSNIHAVDPEARTGVPQKIVSINLCSDELLLQLVAPERVAALTKFSADPEFSTIAGKARDIKKIQGGIEDVQACGPDLLLGGRFSHKETMRFFRNAGIPVLTFGIPKNFEDIYADILRLAAAVGEVALGDQIVMSMKAELVSLRPKAPSKQRAIFLQSGGLVPGLGTFENAIMEAAGLENLAAASGIKDYGSLSLEQLIRMKPNILIFASDQKKRPTVRGEVLDHPAIKKALPHVKSVTLPSAILNCGSPASVEAVRILVKEAQ
jgi:iron complex transport system substrate-binding protein